MNKNAIGAIEIHNSAALIYVQHFQVRIKKITISQPNGRKSRKYRHFASLNFKSSRKDSVFIFLIFNQLAEIWSFCC